MTGRANASPSAYFALPPHIQQLFSSKLFAPRTPDRVIPTMRDYIPTEPTAGFMDDASCIYVHNGTIEDLRSVAHAITTIITVQESAPQVYDTITLTKEALAQTIDSFLDHPPSNGSYHRGVFIDPITSSDDVKTLWENLSPERQKRFYSFDVIATLDHKTAYPIESEPLELTIHTAHPRHDGSHSLSSSRFSPPSATLPPTLEKRL